MKKIGAVIFGIILVIVGIIFGLNNLNITDLNIFFDGWWTLFIIIPSIIGLFKDSDRSLSIICLVIGVLLLLACQNLFDFDIVLKLIFPIIIVVIGIKLIINGTLIKPKKEELKSINKNGKKKEYVSTFGSSVFKHDETLDICEINAVFGSAEVDFTESSVDSDAIIEIDSVFGSTKIFLPKDVNVKVNPQAIFGDVKNNRNGKTKEGRYTVYVYANSVFGGVEIN